MAKQPAEVGRVRQPSSTFPVRAVPAVLAFLSPAEKRNRLRPLVGVSTGVGRSVSTLLGPPSSLGFQVPGGGRRVVRGNAQNPNLPCPFVRSPAHSGDAFDHAQITLLSPADFEKSDDRRMDEIRLRSSSFFRKKKEKRNGIEVSYRKCKKRGGTQIPINYVVIIKLSGRDRD